MKKLTGLLAVVALSAGIALVGCGSDDDSSGPIAGTGGKSTAGAGGKGGAGTGGRDIRAFPDGGIAIGGDDPIRGG